MTGAPFRSAELEGLALAAGLSVSEPLDEVASRIAETYHRGALTFEVASRLVNQFHGAAVLGGIDVPAWFLEVYFAFDEGEYMHPGDPPDTDAEAKYTRPRIARLLEHRRAAPPHVQTDLALTMATVADADFAYDVFARTMRGYAEATWGVWHADKARAELARDCVDGKTRMVQVGSHRVGLVRVVQEVTHLQLEKLNIVPEWQGREIGTQVLQLVIGEARSLALPLRLRVLRVNPARRLYERMGFVVRLEEDVRFHLELAST